jgi:hypothetical protein
MNAAVLLTAEQQKVVDGLAGLLAVATKILAALDGVHVDADEPPSTDGPVPQGSGVPRADAGAAAVAATEGMRTDVVALPPRAGA